MTRTAPDRSLGWHVASWCYENLRQPDGPEAGEPWEFTREQLRFVLDWYAVDRRDRFVHRTGTLRRMKGWGKSPFGAVLALVELVGPCRPSGQTSTGFHPRGLTQPVGEPHAAPWVTLAGVSLDQTRNVLRVVPGLVSQHLVDAAHLDVGKTVIYAHNARAVLEAVTSSPRALEGGRITFCLADETQHWLSSNGGHEMAQVITGNVAKSRDGASRVLSICNAHRPGEDSVAERDHDAYQAVISGRSKAKGILYDSVEAPPDTDLTDEASLRAGLTVARGDSTWLDLDRLVAEVADPRTPASESRRKYLNQVIAAEDAWIAPHEWDRLADATVVVADGSAITLGFDGSKSDDDSALVACDVASGHLFALGVWSPPPGGEVDRVAIDGAVRQAFDRFDVVGFYSDLYPWESYVDAWTRDLGDTLAVRAGPRSPVGWDMRGREHEFTRACEQLHDAIVEGAVSHDGDARTRRHFHNARRRPNRWGVSVTKEHRESARKIDAVPAAVLAALARREYIALTPGRRRQPRRSGRVIGV